MKKLTKIFCLVLALAMMLSLAACGGTSDNPGANDNPGNNSSSNNNSGEGSGTAAGGPKNLVYGINRDTNDASPYATLSASRQQFMRLLYNYLFAAPYLGAPSDKLQGEIGKSFSVDGNIITVEIYDYVKDSAGNAITAEDVVFSYQTSAASVNGTMLAGAMGDIRAIDDTHVEIEMAAGNIGDLEFILTFVPIVSKSWYENATDAEITTSPIGTGPYVLNEIVSGSHASFSKNEDFWQTDESLRSVNSQQIYDNVTFKVILESAMNVIALENGEVDLARQIPATDLDTFRNDDYMIFPNLGSMFYCLMFNNGNSVFANNKALRQAVLYGFDSESVRLAFGNDATSGSVLHTVGAPVYADYNDAWDNEDYYGYNLEKAKELMAEAGYPDGGLTLRLLYVKNTNSDAMVTVFQNYMAELGITLDLLAYDQAMFDTLKYDSTAWDLEFDQKGGNPPYITNVWLGLFDPANYSDGDSCFTHDDTFVDLLYTAVNAETHSAETVEAFHDYLKEQAYLYGVFYNYEFFVAQSGIEIVQDGNGNCTPTLFKLADDYKSVAD